MTFLYETDLNALPIECPSADYRPMNTTAYRFVFDEIDNPDNFKPMFFKNPRRANSMDDVQKCQAMALSLFENLEKAIVRFQKLKKQNGNTIYRTIGSHIAFANITEDDGVNSNVNAEGHFSHHPAVEGSYKDRFIIVDVLL